MHAVYKRLWVGKITTSSYYLNGNVGVERVDHTIPEILVMVVNMLQTNWDEELSYVEFAYNNSVSAATGLVPNEVHMGRFPLLPLTISERTGVDGHQLARDRLRYGDLWTGRRQRAYDIVFEHPAFTVSRVERRILSPLRRTARGSQISRWQLDVGVQYGCHIRQGAKT